MEAKEPIVLVLMRDEAQAIADLTANVAGPKESRRRFTQSVLEQLRELDVHWQMDAFKPFSPDLEFRE